MFFFVFLFLQQCMALYWLYISETRQWLVSRFILLFGEGGDVTLLLRYSLCIFSCIRRFPYGSVCKIRNTGSGLYCWFSHDVTLCSGTKKPVNWLVKKQHANGIEKYQALKYSPLILKLQVTFTKRLSFKMTFKGHSIIWWWWWNFIKVSKEAS